MIWLDHLLFGCGRGLKSPCFDAVYYWIDGRFYHFSGGHGSQLFCFQWRTPRPGQRRKILGRHFTPYQVRRKWLRVRVSWRMMGLDPDTDKLNEQIRQLKQDLDDL